MSLRVILSSPKTKDGKELTNLIFGSELIEACINSDVDKVHSCVKSGVDLNEGDYLTKNTPLHWACMTNNHEIAKVLLNAGADLNAVNTQGMKPLHSAAAYADGEMCKLIISSGAFVNGVCNQKFNPIDFAFDRKNHSALQGLLEAGANPNQFSTKEDKPIIFSAIKNYDFKSIDILLDAGADVTRSNNGYSPLHLMIAKHGGDTESKNLIYKIIACGADLNAQDPKGYTPLHYATAKDDEKIVTKLITNGASASLRDKEGHTPLHYTENAPLRNLIKKAQQRDMLIEKKDEVFNKFLEQFERTIKTRTL